MGGRGEKARTRVKGVRTGNPLVDDSPISQEATNERTLNGLVAHYTASAPVPLTEIPDDRGLGRFIGEYLSASATSAAQVLKLLIQHSQAQARLRGELDSDNIQPIVGGAGAPPRY